jgi:hypothetical protein
MLVGIPQGRVIAGFTHMTRVPARVAGKRHNGSRVRARKPGSHVEVTDKQKEAEVAKDHGPSVKNDKQYEGLRKKGMSKSRAAAIANSPGASSRGGKQSGSGGSSSRSRRSSGPGSGGNRAQKAAAGRKGAKKSSGS